MVDAYFKDKFDLDQLKRFQQGDLKMLDSIYDVYAPLLLGIIRKMAGNRLAEEILQQTFAEIWAKRMEYVAEKERFFNWLFRLTRRITIQILNKKDHLENPGSKNRVYGSNANDATDELLEMVMFSGLSNKEVAENLHISSETLLTNIKTAIGRLKTRINS